MLLRQETFFMKQFRQGVVLVVIMIILILMAVMKISVVENIIKKLLTVS